MRTVFTILAMLSGVCAASAQQPAQPAGYRGACSKLTTAGGDATATCGQRLVRTTLADGTEFVIFTTGGTLIGFSGLGGVEGAFQVQFVNIGAPGKQPNPIPAQGSCRYGDLSKPPATVTCTARTAQGAFEGAFRATGAATR